MAVEHTQVVVEQTRWAAAAEHIRRVVVMAERKLAVAGRLCAAETIDTVNKPAALSDSTFD